MSTSLNFNPYKLTDTEIFGANTNHSIAISTIVNGWLSKAGMSDLPTIKRPTSTGFGAATSLAIVRAPVLAKVGQLPKIILADATVAQTAMKSIQTGMQRKYMFNNTTSNVSHGAFGFGGLGGNMVNPTESYNKERKAIISKTESDGNVTFKYNGENYLYWATQHRLIELATDTVKSYLAPLNISLFV